MNDRLTQRAIYLEADGASVFATYHPAAGRPGGSAVLLCPPHGWDELCSHRPLRALADALAASGVAVLRHDPPGTGDSSGLAGDPGQLASWIGSARAGAGWLRQAGGHERIVGLGVGLGGLVACLAAAGSGSLDDLVLWGVPARGRAFVREQRAFAALNASDAGAEPPAPDGAVEAGGFVLSEETVADLEVVDLRTVDFAGAVGRRVLMLERDGIAPDAKLVARLAEGGAEVTVTPGFGYGEMMGHPQQAMTPHATIAEVIDWLGRDGGTVRSRNGLPDASAAEDHAVIAVDGGFVRERPFEIAQPCGTLRGIIVEPDDAPARDQVAVLLNAGAVRRVGPGRQWVALSRAWAAAGMITLRLDLEGIGDADGDRDYADDAALHVPAMVDHVGAAIDALEERLEPTPRRFLLAGLCSGGYWGFHTALRDERVRELIMLNPRALSFDLSLAMEREVRKVAQVATASGRQRIHRRNLTPERLRRLLVYLARAPFEMPAARRRASRRRRYVADAFDRLRERGTRVLMVFGEDEPLYEELEMGGLIERLDTWPNLTLECVPGRDHTFRPLEAQRRVRTILDRELEGQLEAPVAGVATRRAT